MKILVACEFSGIVREAFRKRGHDAWSCDLLPTEIPGQHIQDDVLKILDDGWDLMIAHPPCTYLATSGNRWMCDPARLGKRLDALRFIQQLAGAPIEHIAIENPLSVLSGTWRKPDQIIQPWQFGHGEIKSTCFWLKNLPKLKPTCIVPGRWARVFRHEGPGPQRWKNRSRTYPGIAEAMVDQWGNLESKG